MRDFLKYTFASFLGIVLFVTVGFGGLLFLVVALSTASRDTEPAVEEQSILTLDLSTNISDAPSSLAPGDVIGVTLAGNTVSRPLTLRTVLNALDAAATDDRIVGLYLYGNVSPNLTGGWASLGEIRDALAAFEKSGKPIWVYTQQWSERDYYLTSVADTVVMSPVGYAEINGFSSEVTFFAGAFQKYGIGVQPIRVGRYKSAVEPFTRAERSPEEREQTQKLLSDLWTNFLSVVAESRDLTAQQVQAIANTQGLLLPNEAKAAGLIDRVAHADEILSDLHQLTGEDEDEQSFRQVDLASYAASAEQPSNQTGGQIALVYAEGEIVSGEGSSGTVGGDRLATQLRELRFDDDVKAVVLRINSPGGSASAAEQVAREVFLTQKEKPVIVSMGGLAASGGYQIATYANKIFAAPTTITGSIGVFGLLPNVQDLANRNGITWDVVKTAPFADAETISRPKTPQELAIIQRVVNQLYDQFISSVAESRSLPKDKVEAIAQGRVWSGTAAKQIGLVDELGGLDSAIQEAVKAAELGDAWYIQEYPEPRSLEQQLIKNLFSSQVTAAAHRDPLTTRLQSIWADLEVLRSFNDPLGIYARLSFNPRID